MEIRTRQGRGAGSQDCPGAAAVRPGSRQGGSSRPGWAAPLPPPRWREPSRTPVSAAYSADRAVTRPEPGAAGEICTAAEEAACAPRGLAGWPPAWPPDLPPDWLASAARRPLKHDGVGTTAARLAVRPPSRSVITLWPPCPAPGTTFRLPPAVRPPASWRTPGAAVMAGLREYDAPERYRVDTLRD